MPDRVLSILQHALGVDQYGQREGRESRWWYVTDEGSDDWEACMELAAAGLVKRHGPSELYGGSTSYAFMVTDAGREFVRANSPKPPKKTAGQLRYEEWLDVADLRPDLTFGEWLKQRSREKREACHG